jgi:hypothetical protein
MKRGPRANHAATAAVGPPGFEPAAVADDQLAGFEQRGATRVDWLGYRELELRGRCLVRRRLRLRAARVLRGARRSRVRSAAYKEHHV